MEAHGNFVTSAAAHAARLAYVALGAYLGLVSALLWTAVTTPGEVLNGALRGVKATAAAAKAYLDEGQRLTHARVAGAGVPVSKGAAKVADGAGVKKRAH